MVLLLAIEEINLEGNMGAVKKRFVIVGLLYALGATAGTMGPQIGVVPPSAWSATGSLGYTNYQNMVLNDGQTAFGRFALGRDLFILGGTAFGLQLGLQSGNDMRFDVPDSTLDQLGGLFIQSTMKPSLDLLATLQTSTLGSSPLFLVFNGGIVYRRWQFNDRVNTVSNIAGEVQGGIGFSLTQTLNLTILYQGIFAGTPYFTVTPECPNGDINTTPIQQGALLGFTYYF